jgi:acyl dehydratase
MQINGTIFHGWLLLCALSALTILDELTPVEGQPAASSHLGFYGVQFLGSAGFGSRVLRGSWVLQRSSSDRFWGPENLVEPMNRAEPKNRTL